MARIFSLAVLAFAACTQAFVLPAARPMAVARTAAAVQPLVMTSLDKKEKAKHIKLKSSRSATKRFKPTATGKLLRRRPFKQHILTKKHPQRKQKLSRTMKVCDAELKTMQKMLLVSPKRK